MMAEQLHLPASGTPVLDQRIVEALRCKGPVTSSILSSDLGIPTYDETGRGRVQRRLQALKKAGLLVLDRSTERWRLVTQVPVLDMKASIVDTDPESPLTRRCPHCGAKIGEPCSGRIKIHAARFPKPRRKQQEVRS